MNFKRKNVISEKINQPNINEYSKIEGSYTKNYFIKNKELGYGPLKDTRVSAVKTLNGNHIYNVEYIINNNGLRHLDYIRSSPSLLFFGCSYMFGEGLNNNETLPYLLIKLFNNHFNGFNYGFHGYGPHQMLRALEIDLPTHHGAKDVKAAIFQTASWHIYRSGGFSEWDQSGPNYKIINNKITYSGPFHSKLYNNFLNFITKHFHILKLMHNRISALKMDNYINLSNQYIQILDASRKIIDEKFNAPFYVLFWDEPYIINNNFDLTNYLLQKLELMNFNIVKVSESTNELSFDKLKIAHDGHPNIDANKLNAIALKNIIQAQ